MFCRRGCYYLWYGHTTRQLDQVLHLIYYLHFVEDRPGHQRKLYQYCSSDVRDIVQQHLRVSRIPA
jgi:hypothetical protein